MRITLGVFLSYRYLGLMVDPWNVQGVESEHRSVCVFVLFSKHTCPVILLCTPALICLPLSISCGFPSVLGLDGSTPAFERERLINQFNDPSNLTTWLFLLSTRWVDLERGGQRAVFRAIGHMSRSPKAHSSSVRRHLLRFVTYFWGQREDPKRKLC